MYDHIHFIAQSKPGERGGLVVENRTLNQEVLGLIRSKTSTPPECL